MNEKTNKQTKKAKQKTNKGNMVRWGRKKERAKEMHLNDDTLGLVLEVEGLGEKVNIGLGAGVDSVEGITNGDEPGGGAHIDDDALLLLHHPGEDELGHLGEGDDIDVDELVNDRVLDLVKVLGVGVAHTDVVNLIHRITEKRKEGTSSGAWR